VPSLHIKFINSRVDCSQKLYKKAKRILEFSLASGHPLFDFKIELKGSLNEKSNQKMSLLDATI
jgi:hypothetical protein